MKVKVRQHTSISGFVVLCFDHCKHLSLFYDVPCNICSSVSVTVFELSIGDYGLHYGMTKDDMLNIFLHNMLF